MPESKSEVRAVSVEYICDKCGEAPMQAGNYALTSNPPKWPHTCPKCGHTANLSETYPAVRYEPAQCCEGGPQWGHAWGCPKCTD